MAGLDPAIQPASPDERQTWPAHWNGWPGRARPWRADMRA